MINCGVIMNSFCKQRRNLPFWMPITGIRAIFTKSLDLACAQEKRKNWESVVGLEVHAQIKTSSKLFSGSANKFASPANSLVSLFDCAIPGTLPVLNKKAVEAALLTALALNCNVNLVSEFDRKHYFYADMPAGYQITQQRLPLASDGYLDFAVFSSAVHKAAYKKQSKIKQLQLEQDSGKSLHEESCSGSLIDLNRAGVGLMELVFEPDLKDGEEAVACVSELIRILEALETCDCKMEEGSLRVDANISVNKPGETFGTRTEVKNLNSLRALARSIDYEIVRQIEVLEKGGKITNETRGYDPQQKITLSMRDKEEKQDYRYMPEPNLLPLSLLQLKLDPSDFRVRIPVLPEQERTMLMEKYQLSLETAIQLVNGRNIDYFLNVMDALPNLPVKKVCSLLLTDLLGLLHKDEKTIQECQINPRQFAKIVELVKNKKISHSASQNLLLLLYRGDLRHPEQVVEEEGWTMINDPKQLEVICKQIISENPKSVAAFRAGKAKIFKSLAAQLKKECNDKYDMGDATQTLKRLLEEKNL
ncbi:glutamyl-tRNA(Gln) amidotransferase subunit B, mitochondrial-like [Daphnia pulex]|uniref:glutamyl-tRNA(Gln) amidotransferase subunit B, mitochondrial-like n=1 Tax=Daphnia pulex TaxID=6669 RepID=UPI001EDFE8DE|nr:glutamyl-tRNA(Gln) amidotransferase subunit B, mitochondrial-like [Daphnia pulex]